MLADIIMESPLLKTLFAIKGLFIHGSIVHFEINIIYNHSTDMKIPKNLSSIKHHNERAV